MSDSKQKKWPNRLNIHGWESHVMTSFNMTSMMAVDTALRGDESGLSDDPCDIRIRKDERNAQVDATLTSTQAAYTFIMARTKQKAVVPIGWEMKEKEGFLVHVNGSTFVALAPTKKAVSPELAFLGPIMEANDVPAKLLEVLFPEQYGQTEGLQEEAAVEEKKEKAAAK